MIFKFKLSFNIQSLMFEDVEVLNGIGKKDILIL